ncbi:hypothetical protein [Streptococcus saliviloxodontae]|uniref:Uncharacterized protein n=1 Tax=Streptococcus saliviloxodontae TaxID=1349416 RepID=A0ABS2PP37_9STRE|nr:hypothetical protein [Streptococcus saliviloxodontae]MBM7636871.1 hypothetical protein [Streptococcus saliviloxodontae]
MAPLTVVTASGIAEAANLFADWSTTVACLSSSFDAFSKTVTAMADKLRAVAESSASRA